MSHLPTLAQDTSQTPTAAGRRVLIAEDNPDLRQIFARVFLHHHFVVEMARDGAEAMACLADQQPPDVMILDVNMPHLSGLEVLAYIRQTPHLKALKVIVVTGNSVAMDHPDAQQADLFLLKPISINELIIMTRRLIADL